MRIACSGLMFLLALPLGSVAAQQQEPPQQQQEDSLAEAARRAREQKKDQAKPAKVWDNDNVPAAGRTVNVVGHSEEAGGEATNQQAGAENAAGAETANPENKPPQDSAAAQAELSSAKDRLQTLKADLDVLQRKYALDSQTYLSNPNPPEVKSGADSLADEQTQIAAKQQEVEDQQKKVDELNEKLKESTPSSNPPPSNQN
jgi:hypothetical protein